jgi:hypothetical protein
MISTPPDPSVLHHRVESPEDYPRKGLPSKTDDSATRPHAQRNVSKKANSPSNHSRRSSAKLQTHPTRPQDHGGLAKFRHLTLQKQLKASHTVEYPKTTPSSTSAVGWVLLCRPLSLANFSRMCAYIKQIPCHLRMSLLSIRGI